MMDRRAFPEVNFPLGHPRRGINLMKYVIAIAVVIILVAYSTKSSGILKTYQDKYGVDLAFLTRNAKPPELVTPSMELPVPLIHRFLPNAYLYHNDTVPYKDSLLAFLHNPKSAGTSMKNCLLSITEKLEKPEPTVVAVDTAHDVKYGLVNQKTTINEYYMGESVMGICDFVNDQPCSYFTVMREPYERAVSHYYFCKGGGEGWPPCDNTLEEFTLSLCSLFFRQMTMHLPCERVSNDTSSEWLCKNHVVTIDHFHNIEDKRAATLQYIVNNIDKIFAVIGLTEEFETSLKMFEHTFGEPFEMCQSEHSNAGGYMEGEDIKNMRGDRKRVQREAKERLMQNEDVQKCLHEDVVIYKRVKEIFDMQKRVLKWRLDH